MLGLVPPPSAVAPAGGFGTEGPLMDAAMAAAGEAGAGAAEDVDIDALCDLIDAGATAHGSREASIAGDVWERPGGVSFWAVLTWRSRGSGPKIGKVVGRMCARSDPWAEGRSDEGRDGEAVGPSAGRPDGRAGGRAQAVGRSSGRGRGAEPEDLRKSMLKVPILDRFGTLQVSLISQTLATVAPILAQVRVLRPEFGRQAPSLRTSGSFPANPHGSAQSAQERSPPAHFQGDVDELLGCLAPGNTFPSLGPAGSRSCAVSAALRWSGPGTVVNSWSDLCGNRTCSFRPSDAPRSSVPAELDHRVDHASILGFGPPIARTTNRRVQECGSRGRFRALCRCNQLSPKYVLRGVATTSPDLLGDRGV